MKPLSFFNFIFTVSRLNIHPVGNSNTSKALTKKGVLKIYNKFTGEHPCRSVISLKLLCY